MPSDSRQERIPGRAISVVEVPESPQSIRLHGRPSRHTKVHPSADVLPPPSPGAQQYQQQPPPPYAASTEPLITSTPPVFIRSAAPCRWEKKASWVRLGDAAPAAPAVGSVVVAGAVLLLSGALSCLLCFYGLSQGGRRYYLDFGLLSGFSSVLIGSLGLRARNWQRSPNRNYVTGYIILSIFSVLTTAGLIVLNFWRLQSTSRSIHGVTNNNSNPIIDLVGGAECGIAVLSIAIALAGLILLTTSRGGITRCLNCCGDPPPDDRVAHRAEGFTL